MYNLQDFVFIWVSVYSIFHICISVPLSVCLNSAWSNGKSVYLLRPWRPYSYLGRLEDRPRHATLLISRSFIYNLSGFLKRFRAAIFPQTSFWIKLKIKLGTMRFSQGIMHVMNMVLTGKELFLKLAVPKQAKSLKTTLCRIVNGKYYINFLK